MRGRNWDHFYSFLLSFSFLNPKVKNYNNTHKCSLRNQKDILDNPIPCKPTLLVYSLWNTNWRHDPTYAPQYKSKHSNYVKLSNLLLKLLDTHSWYPDRECSLGGLLMLSLPKDIKIVFLGRNEHSKISCNYLWRDTFMSICDGLSFDSWTKEVRLCSLGLCSSLIVVNDLLATRNVRMGI